MDRLDALRLFLDVAEIGSFSGVARQRALATSTVSLAINQLEAEFNAVLIRRSTRRLVFTHEGEMLLVDARRIVSEWDAAMADLREDGPLSGPIRVTATNDFGRRHLRRHLDDFQRLYPDIHVGLVLSDNSIDLIDQRIDIALRYGPLVDSNLRARLILRGYRHVCASPRYWDRVGRPSHPYDLLKHNCLILDRPGAPLTAWPFLENGKQFSVKVAGDRSANDGGLIREWAIDGVGVVIKNGCDIQSELEEGVLETALDDYIASSVDLYLVQPAGVPSRRVVTLLEYLASVIGKSGGHVLGPDPD
ncbi:MAG: LysR family transcriptional regulator [Thalassospira sp.]|nr:LysR family transcriptional regulator [Thalassospira sp.]